MPTLTTDSASAAESLDRAREWGEAFGYPVVVYEWIPRQFAVVHLSLWSHMDVAAVAPLTVHALVWQDSIVPLTLLALED